MQELEKDYQSGNISEDKYNYLSKEYTNILATVDATSRIRNMQGRQNTQNPSSKANQRSMAEASKREDQSLVNKYVVRSSEEKQKRKKQAYVSNKGKYAILVVVFIIAAFIVGISFGLFSGPQSTIPTNAAIMIDDSAFPEVIANSTNSTDVVDNTDTSSLNNTGFAANNGTNNGGSDNPVDDPVDDPVDNPTISPKKGHSQ